MLLFLLRDLLLRRQRPAFAHGLLFQLPTLNREGSQPVGQFSFLGGQLGFGFVEVAAAGGKLSRLFLQQLHFFFRHAKPFETSQRGFNFLLAIAELPLCRLELRFAIGKIGHGLAQFSPLYFDSPARWRSASVCFSNSTPCDWSRDSHSVILLSRRSISARLSSVRDLSEINWSISR